MKNTRLSFIILFLLITCIFVNNISAIERITVRYKGTSDTESIAIRLIDGIPFFNITELNKTLNAYISSDVIDKRVYVDLYGQRLIFLLDTSYLLFDSQVYNLIFNIATIDGRAYLPVSFFQRIIPHILTDKLSYDLTTDTLFAEPPVDSSLHTIVIDPGHGGKDPGAIGASGKVFEKDIVLNVARRVKMLVEQNLDVKVLLTREDDRFIPLHQRTTFANSNRANLFISIHCNAAPRRTAQGIETFFLSAARSDEARAVELLENSVVEKYEGGAEALKRYDDLSFILMDMAQTEQLRESSYLALKLQANLVKKTGAVDRGVKQAGFYVLRGAFMPSVLVELGFISNAQEERKMTQPAYQESLAEAIYEGIKSYIYNYEMFR